MIRFTLLSASAFCLVAGVHAQASFSCDSINSIAVAYGGSGGESHTLLVDVDEWFQGGFPCPGTGLKIVGSPTGGSFFSPDAGGWNGCVLVQAGLHTFDFTPPPHLESFYLRIYHYGFPCGPGVGPYQGVSNSDFQAFGAVSDASGNPNRISLTGTGGAGVSSALIATGATAVSPGLLGLSFQAAQGTVFGASLLIDLAPSNLLALFVVVSNSNGEARFDYLPPASLSGLTIHAQVFFLDSSVPGGVAASNRLSAVM